jgi:hypothetical protein
VRKLFSTKRRIVIAGLTTTVALAGGASAFAFFTATGSGVGSAAVGSTGTFTVASAGAATGGPILPGTGTEDLPFTVTNAGTGAQAYNSATATVNVFGGVGPNALDVTVVGVAVPGCLASWFNPTALDPTPAYGTTIAPGDAATQSISLTMTDTGTNQDACQGINPDVTLTVNAGA